MRNPPAIYLVVQGCALWMEGKDGETLMCTPLLADGKVAWYNAGEVECPFTSMQSEMPVDDIDAFIEQLQQHWK